MAAKTSAAVMGGGGVHIIVRVNASLVTKKPNIQQAMQGFFFISLARYYRYGAPVPLFSTMQEIMVILLAIEDMRYCVQTVSC